MSNTTTSPNMNLVVPTASNDPGPDWAGNINASLSIIDQHNHAPGSGVQITQAGISLTSTATSHDSLAFNGTNAYSLRSIRFTAQSAALALATDVGCIYEAGVDLYYNDGSGNQIRLTQGGSIVGTSGSISGLPSGTASASYSGGTFVWQSATNTAANMDAGSYILRNSSASSKGLTLQPPNSMAADYSLTLPSVPASTSIMRLDSSGNMSAALLPDNSTIVISSNTLQVPSGGITATQIAAGTITGTQIANNISLPGVVKVNSEVVVVAQFFASGTMAFVRGDFDLNGNVLAGEGFSVAHVGTGQYTITFTNSFSAAPVVVGCLEGNTAGIVATASTTAAGFNVNTWNVAGTARDFPVRFYAFGLL